MAVVPVGTVATANWAPVFVFDLSFFLFFFEFVFLSRDRTVVPMMGSVVPASGTPIFVFVFSHFLYCSAHETDPTTADARRSHPS